MCMTKQELETAVQEIRRYRTIIEEATDIQKSLEAEVVAYMIENKIDTATTDTATITYRPQTRATLDRKRLEEDFGNLEMYTKITEYSVLRIR